MKASLTRIKEETKKRTENSKHYFNNDGSYTAEISGGPIHYKDRNNQWQDIDTTVVISDDPNYDFMNITNSTKTYFKKEISDITENIKIIKNDSTILIKSAINLKLLDFSFIKTLQTLNSSILQQTELNKIKFSSIYNNGTKNINIDYHILSDKLHEEFVINEPMEFPEISQEITLINAYFKQENKSIYIYNQTTNNIIGILPPPVMFEQNNPLNVNYDLHYEIINLTKNSFIITKILDIEGKNWFFSPDRIYPLIIDTDFTGSINDEGIKGRGSSYAIARSTSYSVSVSASYIDLGQFTDGKGNYEVYRVYYKFDTSSIGSAANITQVNLTLTIANDTSSTDFIIRIHKYDWSGTDPLTSGNMETAYDGALVSTYDADWRSTSGISINTPYTSGNLSTSWINKTGNTYYAVLSARDINNTAPTSNEYVRIYLQEASTASYRPILNIIYTTSIPEQLIIVDNY